MPDKEPLSGLDLFSGIGGITKALADWIRPIAYCENDRYAQSVLLSRMASGDLPVAPIWDDIRTLRGSDIPKVDIIYGGFPCQDISVAGHGKGLEGSRSGLFFEIMRLAEEIQPTFIFLENVPAIRTRGASRVVQELASRGYDCRWGTLSAQDVGAPHKRQRWFLLAAHSECLELRIQSGRSGGQDRPDQTESGNHGAEESLADADSVGSGPGGTGKEIRQREPDSLRTGWWTTEPNVGRVAYGIPARVDRIKCLGNAVVPRQVREAFMFLVGLTPPVQH